MTRARILFIFISFAIMGALADDTSTTATTIMTTSSSEDGTTTMTTSSSDETTTTVGDNTTTSISEKTTTSSLRSTTAEPTATAAQDDEPTSTTATPSDSTNAKVSILLENLTFQQPLRGLCLYVSTLDFEDNDSIISELLEGVIYIPGQEASEGLGELATLGSCDALNDEIKERTPDVMIPENVEVQILQDNPDDSNLVGENAMVNFTIPIELDDNGVPPVIFVSMASNMANTNDGFIALQRVPLILPRIQGLSVFNTEYATGLDAGVELNTQLCEDMDAPACPAGSPNNNAQPGEEKVHVHRGMHGPSSSGGMSPTPSSGPTSTSTSSETTVLPQQNGDDDAEMTRLDAATYDWRAPVARVTFVGSWIEGDGENEEN